jgi:hypothetical protein
MAVWYRFNYKPRWDRENYYPLSQSSSNLGTGNPRSSSHMILLPPPCTSSPSPALALPFFLRLALKTDLRRLTLPLPLAPSCRGLVILPATALACKPSRPLPEGSNLFLGSASEKEFYQFHLFRVAKPSSEQGHLAIPLVQLRPLGLMLATCIVSAIHRCP